eukprot:TRINITY_DN13606_c0_g1_i1.p1 TRINITY_DN13606_c0_g1~~TRINITY_DN13606_c0_g1_i1.p1  ORF type:complete len:199 (+),score=47.34 TRINITY_DN13606_c0_g1_i1:79-597(+)
MIKTITLILSNIVEHPSELKYRKLPHNPTGRLSREVLEPYGGKNFLLAAGFRKKKFEDSKIFWYVDLDTEETFEQHFQDVVKAHTFIAEKLEEMEAKHYYEVHKAEIEAEKEAERAEIALKQFQEDRENFDERRKMMGPVHDSVAKPYRSREETHPSHTNTPTTDMNDDIDE